MILQESSQKRNSYDSIPAFFLKKTGQEAKIRLFVRIIRTSV